MPERVAHDEVANAESSGPGRTFGHVAGLDGLRAVAVSLVFAFHLRLVGFDAGYLGVDIFFVISGFLITSLLLAEVRASGRVSLPAFWARRVRRLLPALALVSMVVALVAAFTATATELLDLRGDLLATTFYVANWRFIETSSYFANNGVESPLLHAWSLAIEEQFYLVWPIAASVAIFWWRRAPARAVGSVAAVVTVVSAILLAWWWEPVAVDRAYMGTDAKVFEPLIGALGACVMTAPRVRAWVERHGHVLAGAGATGIVVALVTIRPDTAVYYRGGALALCVAALAVIAAVWVGRAGPTQAFLSWRPIVWVGTISYGLYLWHWPITLWTGARDPVASMVLGRRAFAIAVTFAAATASYYLLERPIRRGFGLAAHRRAGWSRRPGLVLALVPVSLLVIAAVSVTATRVPPVTADERVLLLVGDSVPQRLEVALDRELETLGWRLVSATHGGCPVTGELTLLDDGEPMPISLVCPAEVVTSQDAAVTASHPDIVLWWDRLSIAGFRTVDGESVAGGTRRFWDLRRDGLASAVERLRREGGTVVFVATEPPGQEMWQGPCDGARCLWMGYQVDHYDDITTRWNSLLREYVAAHPGETAVIDIGRVICREQVALCDDTVGGAPARPDGSHYEGAGADLAITTLLAQLAPYLGVTAPAVAG